MSRSNIFIGYAHGVHSPEENFARTQALCARLADIHSLFAMIYPRTVGGRRKYKAELPWFPEMTFVEWQAIYLAHMRFGDSYGGSPDTGVTGFYWNRIKTEDFQELEINYDVFWQWKSNEVLLTDLAKPLIEPGMPLVLMRACIESFDAFRAESAWLNTDRDDLTFLYYRLWLKDGEPFPEGRPKLRSDDKPKRERMNRYPEGHPPPSQQEPWLGGTLYTWPEHDPLLLVEREASAKA